MLQPSRTKYRKAHKGRIHGAAKGGFALNFGAYGAVVSIKEQDGELRFSHDDKDNLALLGVCGKCRTETLSKPVGKLEDLGKFLERFEPGSSHQC